MSARVEPTLEVEVDESAAGWRCCSSAAETTVEGAWCTLGPVSCGLLRIDARDDPDDDETDVTAGEAAHLKLKFGEADAAGDAVATARKLKFGGGREEDEDDVPACVVCVLRG